MSNVNVSTLLCYRKHHLSIKKIKQAYVGLNRHHMCLLLILLFSYFITFFLLLAPSLKSSGEKT